MTVCKPIKHNLRFVKYQPMSYISNVETDIGVPTPYPHPLPIYPYLHNPLLPGLPIFMPCGWPRFAVQNA